MKKTYYTNIQKKKLCNRNNGELKTLPRFDFQMEDYFSVIFVDSLNKIIEIDPTDQFYIAGGLDVMKDSENLLFYSEDFTLENNKLTFTIDTYTDNYLKHIKNTNTPIYLEIGILNEKKTILLQDTVLAEPRVYLDGVAPTNIKEYYTKEQIDEKLAAVKVEQTDPIYTADKPTLALKSEIPTKTSDLQNDSGFITADDIPSVEVTETDPIYTADKPNLALKSELFSKSYNDLTDKPDLYTPVSDGDGSKFLADDGTYKTVQSGSSSDVDLSDYTGNVNLKYDSGNSYLKTSDKTFSLGTQPVNYVSQMKSANINAGDLLNITTDYFRIMDAKAYKTLFVVDNWGNAQATSSIDSPNVRVNGMNVAVVQNQNTYYQQNLNIQPDNNQFYYPVYTDVNWSEGIYSLELNIYQNVDNFTLIFKTAADFVSYTINMYAENFLINKPFNFESNKKYIICIDKNIIFWAEIQDYVAEVQE